MPKTSPPPSAKKPGTHRAVVPPWSAIALQPQIGGRSEQQDACWLFTNPAESTLLIVVCDGVGGCRNGDEASAIVVRTAEELWRNRNGVLTEPKIDLLKMSAAAHGRITDLAGMGDKRAPASTIVALYLTPTEAHWVHSGDSRLYRFRNGKQIARTRDHSVVQILFEQGEVSEEQMGEHPDQGRLLQSLGTKEYREPTYGTDEVTPTDAFVLCTDGFWERTPPRVMLDMLAGDSRGLEARLKKAVARAAEANGPEGDNLTVAAVVPKDTSPGASARLPKRAVAAALLVVTGLLLAAVAAYLLTRPDPVVVQQPPPTPAPQEHETPERKQEPEKAVVGDLNAVRDVNLGKPLDVGFVNFRGMRFHPVKRQDGTTLYMTKYEVTREDWNAISPKPRTIKDGEELQPITDITPDEAQEFARLLTQKDQAAIAERGAGEKWHYRLPEAMEWIASGRGPDLQWTYPWGMEKKRPEDFGNVGSGKIQPGDQIDRTMDQPFAVSDYVGNVAEMVGLSPNRNQPSPQEFKDFAMLGSHFDTAPGDEETLHNLAALATMYQDMNMREKWSVIRHDEKKHHLGFRLVYVKSAENSASTPPNELADSTDKPKTEPPPAPPSSSTSPTTPASPTAGTPPTPPSNPSPKPNPPSAREAPKGTPPTAPKKEGDKSTEEKEKAKAKEPKPSPSPSPPKKEEEKKEEARNPVPTPPVTKDGNPAPKEIETKNAGVLNFSSGEVTAGAPPEVFEAEGSMPSTPHS
ncbi:serine/threonine protein phosphatase PrpC [Roseimicrobium gellanilyticum]|uniref:Serine/threonine protein phosphatase PrpC n=1 Tax=Roseimicrobium gellanilyticum TaxID=748857 RepID=A0A366HF80_9BACT|nr:PP2C family serine/threonine-protein phosphatase [Roseimicrobium gellanilyticum]RBP41233.1 serine/threonine protein phosphatase PrpC [Roseimicrobium gellanilyticum]